MSGRPNGADSNGESADDPVLRRRKTIARWTTTANRVGYLLYGLAAVLFMCAFPIGWNSGFAAAITVCLVLGSILLAPAIVLGYAIKAAEREDAELHRRRRSS